MVVRALDLVVHCYTQEDGHAVYRAILPLLEQGKNVDLSFDGVETVPSSFINTALISLLEKLSFDTIKAQLRFVDTTRQINEMIRSRFDFEVNVRKQQPPQFLSSYSCVA
jgi:hypothetical protein